MNNLLSHRGRRTLISGLFLLTAGLVLNGCAEKAEPVNADGYPFFLGTYTEGRSEGIYRYRLNHDGSLDSLNLAARSTGPSFLAMGPAREILLAVNEVDVRGSGTVEAWRIMGDTLAFVNRAQTGGAHPCYVTANADGWVLTANYSGGSTALHRLGEDGSLSPLLSTLKHEGSGSHPRQAAPHAHSAYFDPGTENGVISVDLGSNDLKFSQINIQKNELEYRSEALLKMAEAAGPRHLAIRAGGKFLYVVNELNSTVTVVRREPDSSYRALRSHSTLPADFEGVNYCADIHLSPDHRFLYVSNRGHNSIAVFAVSDADGSLRAVAHESVRGDWPRNFAITPDGEFVLVANQKSENIVSFKREANTGKLSYLNSISAPTPVCILF